MEVMLGSTHISNNIDFFFFFLIMLELNGPVSQFFFPSGKQPEQRILAYKQNNQQPVVLQYLTDIAVI